MNWKRIWLLFSIAVALAIFEIQIEGQNGWARNLPCWRAAPDSLVQKIYGALMNDKPCDGFHLSEVALLVLMFHLPFVFGKKWDKSTECEILASFFTMSICWDFLWFIFNPAFGWEKFDASYIWWHKYWIGAFPKDYYGGMVPIILLVFVASSFNKKENFCLTAKRIAKDLIGLLSLTAIAAVIFEITK